MGRRWKEAQGSPVWDEKVIAGGIKIGEEIIVDDAVEGNGRDVYGLLGDC
jgi:hypothetical protein